MNSFVPNTGYGYPPHNALNTVPSLTAFGGYHQQPLMPQQAHLMPHPLMHNPYNPLGHVVHE